MIIDRILMASLGDKHIRLALAERGIRKTNLRGLKTFSAPVEEGEITDMPKLGQIVQEYIKSYKAEVRKVKIVISHPGGIMRFHKSPHMSRADLDKVLGNSMPDYFPPDNRSYVYDYNIISEDAENYYVGILRIPEEVSLSYADFFYRLRMQPLSLDLCANATGGYIRSVDQRNVILVSLSFSKSNILHMKNGNFTSSHDITYDDISHGAFEMRKYFRMLSEEIHCAYLLHNGLNEKSLDTETFKSVCNMITVIEDSGIELSREGDESWAFNALIANGAF